MSETKRIRHGLSGADPTYQTWKRLRSRCMGKSNPTYADYGGRGIRVCAQWSDYRIFLRDMGARPGPGYSIDRIEVNGNYEPGNCRWATPKEQARNKRNTRMLLVNGAASPMAEVAENHKLTYGALKHRLRAGDNPCGRALRPMQRTPVADLTNMRFNRLVALEQAGRTPAKKVLWRCLCDCGKFVIAISAHLRNGNTKSCGCLKLEMLALRNGTK